MAGLLTPSCDTDPRVRPPVGEKSFVFQFPPLEEELTPVHGAHVVTRCILCSHKASETDLMELATSPQPGLADVMVAIATCQATLTAKVEAVQLDVGLLRQDIYKLAPECRRQSRE